MNLAEYHIVEAKLVGELRVALKFRNGKEMERDLSDFLIGPIYEPLKADPSLFESIKVDGGTICWDNGADIDPLVLYWGGQAEAEKAIMSQTAETAK